MKEKTDFFKKIILVCCFVLAIAGVIPTQNGMGIYPDPVVVQAQTQSGKNSESVEETQSTEMAENAEEIQSTEVVEERQLPEYSVTEMNAVMYAQKASNVRSGPSTDYEVIGGLALNTEVAVKGKASTGWYQISYGEQEAFVAGSLLAETPVVIQVQEASVEKASSSGIKERWEYTEEELIQICLSECITAEMSDWDKAVAINNYLRNLITYDFSYSHYSTFDALAYGSAVCQGYANAYQRLMEAAGIPTDYVRGYGWSGSEWGRHGWNRVLIDGQYYYVDVTWNDSSNSNEYLLISYEEMSKDHQQTELNPNRVM